VVESRARTKGQTMSEPKAIYVVTGDCGDYYCDGAVSSRMRRGVTGVALLAPPTPRAQRRWPAKYTQPKEPTSG
jgi:hypothetical protein